MTRAIPQPLAIRGIIPHLTELLARCQVVASDLETPHDVSDLMLHDDSARAWESMRRLRQVLADLEGMKQDGSIV